MADPTKYLLLGASAAEVDDLRLVPGGDPVELNADQKTRLEAAGVELETPQQRGKRLKEEADQAASTTPNESVA